MGGGGGGGFAVTANDPGLVPKLIQAPLPGMGRHATIAW